MSSRGSSSPALSSPALARVLLPALAVGGVLLVAGSALARPGVLVPVATTTAGIVAVACGLLVLAAELAGGAGTSFRRWLGAAITVWGLGQVVQGVVAVVGTPSFPASGDVVSFLAAPLAVVGVLRIPRRARPPARAPAVPGPRWRLPVDSVLLAATAGVLVWQFALLHHFASGAALALHPDSAFALVIVLADLTVTALVVLTAARDLDPNLLLVGVGIACYAAGDLMTLLEMLRDGVWPWQGCLLWCLAAPLIAGGLLRYDPLRLMDAARLGDLRGVEADRSDVDPDARVVLGTSCAGLALLVVGVVCLIVFPAPRADPVSLWLVVAALTVLAVREWLNTRLRGRLLVRLEEQATTDPLTGVANRRVLVDRLASVSPDRPCTLLCIDLDGFKEVNDVLGHPVGDLLLGAAARRVADAVPAGSLVSRVGGDEFAVLVPVDVAAAVAVGEQFVTAVRLAASDVPGVDRVRVSASVGIASVSGPGVPSGSAAEVADPLAALSAAGAALRTAKSGGRDRVEVFDDAASTVRRRRLLVEERLRAAVAAERIGVAFQPIVDLRRGGVAGAEALARWRDDELGVVDPAEFIPVAEETGLVVALGELVLHRTLAEAARLDLGGRGMRVSCNVSPVQLRVPGFHQVVTEALSAHAVRPDTLVVEVTEAVLVEEDGPGVRTLRRLADAGVTIAIDDFGTGYSALGYLLRLPAQVLKIDRSLTCALAEEAEARAIAAAVVELGAGIGVSVVVEGVESPAIADLVARLGAGYGQGAVYGPAMSGDDLVALADRMTPLQTSLQMPLHTSLQPPHGEGRRSA